jgi:hypothetical protein
LWPFAKTATAILLGSAAIVKVLGFNEILLSDGLLSSRHALLAVIVIESAISVFVLLADRWASWLVASITFGTFSVIAGWAWLSDQACNCYGATFGPGLVFVTDAVVLTLLTLVRVPRERVSRLKPLCVAGLGGLTVGVGVLLSNPPAVFSDPLQFLVPESLVGHPWPIDESWHSELSRLQEGEWLVVVLRTDCPHCVELINNHFTEDDGTTPNAGQAVVFVSGQRRWPFQFDRISLNPTGDTSILWPSDAPFVACPAVFVIRDGIVIDAADGKESDPFLQSQLGGRKSLP